MSLRVLGTFTLAMLSVNAVLNLRSLPAMATLGSASLTFFALAALCFLLPSALVCAELATTFPKNGGVYTWVRQAFGDRAGILAIWMEWINNVISFPATLATVLATLAYVGFPELIHHPYVLFAGMLLILWGCTTFNFLGIQISTRFNIAGALLGTILPGVGIIALGFYSAMTHPPEIWHLQDFLPAMSLGSLSIFISTLSAYSGMQITAFHAQNVVNPKRDYPRAIFLATLIIFLTSTLATLSMVIVLPNHSINLMNGVIETFAAFLGQFHWSFLTPLLAILIALGSTASLSAWLVGPARGLQNACADHPRLNVLARLNKAEMPYRILLIQGLICTALAALFVGMPSFQSAFWVLITLTSQFTVLMYILVFCAAIRLRYSQRHIERPFRAGPNWVLCALAGLGALTCAVGFLLGLFPPAVIGIEHTWRYALFVLGGDAIILALPLYLVFKVKFRKES